MTLQEILARLENVKKSGEGYSARCPSHKDEKNSLRVKQGDKRSFLDCFAQKCTEADICASLGINESDLFFDSQTGYYAKSNAKQTARGKQIIAVYPYVDESGRVLYENVRFEPKDFRQRKRDENGREQWNLNGTRRVPYRLPELLEAVQSGANIFLCEGEKDADNVRALGLQASSFKNWRAEFNAFLKTANVFLLCDHDRAGIKQAADAGAIIYGTVESLRVIDLFADEPLPEKHGKDVSDWILERHGEGLSNEEIAELVLILADNADAFSPNKTTAQKAPDEKTDDKPLAIIRASDVTPKKVDWLWYPYIPLEYVTLFSGEEGIGKSWIFCAIASGITNGFLPLLPERFEPQNVLIFSAEDAADDTLVPRLIKTGANLSKVFIVNERFVFDEKGLVRFEHYIAETKPIWVIVDPLFAYSDLRLDLNKPHHARHVAGKFEQIAKKYKIAVSYLIHFNKSKGGGDARQAVSSSQEFSNAARSVVLIGKDPNDETRRALIHRKHNKSPKGKAIGYQITGDKDDVTFRWLGESTLTERDIVDRAGNAAEHAEKSEAVAFLREALNGGRRNAGEIEREAEKLGITKQQLRTGRGKLGVVPKSEGFGKDKKWFWELPESSRLDITETRLDVDKNGNQHLSANRSNKTFCGNNLRLDVDAPHCQHLSADTQRTSNTSDGKLFDASPEKTSEQEAPKNVFFQCWQCGVTCLIQDSVCSNCNQDLMNVGF
jgi:hypothetical protein